MPANPNQSVSAPVSNPNTDVSIVAAILFAGETFRKGLKENEAPIVALRCVKIARAIVDAANNQ